MYPLFANKVFCPVLTAMLLLISSVSTVSAASLTIGEAEQLALKEDYLLQAINARSRSMTELSVAAEKLPDPKLKLGFSNLPTDTFNFDQEPMTQGVIGVQQMFPRGDVRALRSARILEGVARNDSEAEDRMQMVVLKVREEYTRVYVQQDRQRILRESLIVFTDLAEITRDYYGTGRAYQQDVVEAQLELSRVEERIIRIQQQEDVARARLAEWIGAAASRPLEPQWPDIGQPLTAQQIVERLSDHPLMRAWQHEIARAKTSEDIARQAYKPAFAVDLAYGGRYGSNIDGSNRSDMLSVFVTMDIPLFTKNRQDRVLASSIEETSSTQFTRDDIYRSLKARVEEHTATLAREQERLKLYKDLLLPQADFNAIAAFQAYQEAVDDLTTLMRARINEYELKLSNASLRADEIITRARLLYLQGESS